MVHHDISRTVGVVKGGFAAPAKFTPADRHVQTGLGPLPGSHRVTTWQGLRARFTPGDHLAGRPDGRFVLRSPHVNLARHAGGDTIGPRSRRDSWIRRIPGAPSSTSSSR